MYLISQQFDQLLEMGLIVAIEKYQYLILTLSNQVIEIESNISTQESLQ